MDNGEVTMKKVFKSIVFYAVFLVLLPQYVNAQVSRETAQLLRSAKIQVLNKPADPHDFTLPFLDGGSAALSSYKGKIVLLNFWATWCPPCRAEMPSMETLYQRYHKQGLEILAVDLREDASTVQKYIQDNRYTFPVMLDRDGKIGTVFGVEAIPTSYIIDREGKIIGRVVGSIHWDTPNVFAALDALLGSR